VLQHIYYRLCPALCTSSNQSSAYNMNSSEDFIVSPGLPPPSIPICNFHSHIIFYWDCECLFYSTPNLCPLR
jgi:hypothetical protein